MFINIGQHTRGMYIKKYVDAETFARAFWVRECIIKKNAKELTENGYLLRNMSGTIRGAASGYSPYLQAWLNSDGTVVAKVSWGCHTSAGVLKLLLLGEVRV